MTKVGFKTIQDKKDLALIISLGIEGASKDSNMILAATHSNTPSQVKLIQESLKNLPTLIKALVEAAENGEKIEFSEEVINT